MTFQLPVRTDLVHKAIEPRKLSKKVSAIVEAAAHAALYEVKLDGVHVILIKAEGKAYAFSRQGEPCYSMNHVLELLELSSQDNFVLFAEAYHPNLPHRVINGTFRRKTEKPGADKLIAYVFDGVPLADFIAGHCPVRYFSRRNWIKEIVRGCAWLVDDVRLVVTEAHDNLNDAKEQEADARSYSSIFATDGFMQKDREGLWTAGKGTGGEVIKLKDLVDVDVKVLRLVEGKGKFAGMLGALVCEFQGKEVMVSGGTMSTPLREYLWINQHDILGKIVQVHALEINESGALREPRFIRMRPDKRADEVE